MTGIILAYCLIDLRTGEKVGFDEFIDSVSNSRLIFLGEHHTSKECHDFQLDVIKALYERDTNIVIGWEMFQQPYQEWLDKYVQKKVHEVEFLYKTEWHKRWKYDIGLYRSIWKFAREKGIPMVALNIPTEFRKEVRQKDMTYEQLRKTRYMPSDLQPPDSVYIERFKEMVGSHEGMPLDKMVRGMIMWDEGMAKAIADYLKAHPDKNMVVLVGSGHVYGRLGIPDRVERMSGIRGVVVFPVTNVKKDLGEGDYGICLSEGE